MQPERMAGATAEYSSLLQLKAQLGPALKDYGKQHPVVLSLESQIKEMEDFIKQREKTLTISKGLARELTPDDVMKAYVGLLEADLGAMERKRRNLESEISSAEQQSKVLFEYELREEELSNEIKRQEDLYASVVERLRDINMREDSSNLILELIQEPEVGRVVSPNVPVAAVITMMSSMILAGLSVLVAELSDKRVHSAEELESVLGTRVLAHVMDFKVDPDWRKTSKQAKKSKSPVSPEVLTYHAPNFRVCEVYRSIRTELMFQQAAGNVAFGITSPSQGDGKSTSSANLAISLAKAGKSVVLLDADMRRPSIHTLFECGSKFGLSGYLSGKAKLDEIVTKGLVENLTVIRAGQPADDAAELLSSKKFADLIDSLKQQFDYVLVDCPPLLPVADPSIIAPLMDGVLLITANNSLSSQQLKQCKRILDSKNAVLCGVIVNRANDSNSSYEYAGYLNAAYYGTGND
jgi:capsular exopolysaccharide synthesis family protein